MKEQELRFFIDGVRCSKCVAKLEGMATDHPELALSQFNWSNSMLTLKSKDHQDVSPEVINSWIKDLGYKSEWVDESSDIEEQQRLENRRDLTRLAVTFFLGGNLMMFAAAIYTGAASPWLEIFSWLSGVFFIPVAIYSARPFIEEGWRSFKQKRFSADAALSVAFIWGTTASYVHLFQGKTEFYFDSSASFVFLILLVRYILKQIQKQVHRSLNPSLLFRHSPFYSVKNNPKKVNYSDLRNGQIVILDENQALPAAGHLVSESADFNTAWWTGESLPHLYRAGEMLPAGSAAIQPGTQVKLSESFQDSDLNRLFKQMQVNVTVKTQAHSRSEVYSQRLLITVSLIAMAVLAYFILTGNWSEGFRRSLALITVACPCALAFAIPLASLTALKRGIQAGFIVKSPLFFEKLLTVKRIIFDKTGTLTLGRPEILEFVPRKPTSEELSILLGLEKSSDHPFAKSLRATYSTISPVELSDLKVEIGHGISGTYLSHKYEILPLQSKDIPAHISGFSFLCDGQLVFEVHFTDPLRPEVGLLLDKLSRRFKIEVLSGDRPEAVKYIIEKIGLPLNYRVKYRGFVKPESKSSEVTLEPTLMVGDGHNDALALSQATASLAIHGGAPTSLLAADSYSTREGLESLPLAFELAHYYQRLVKQNLSLSLIYNFIAGSAAILGFIDPLAAAVLMPINSLFVITLTAWSKPKGKVWKRSI